MVSESILGYLRNKTILITGATGFLAMVLVEKILRVQPEVKKLYLLIRSKNDESATHRMHNEILDKELFSVLKKKWGNDFDSFISEKVVALAGDVTFENLGVMEDVCQEIQIIFNSAAATSFDGRYDFSLDVNTFGVLHMMNFANKCIKLEILLHVSTAYVCGERSGLVTNDFSSVDEMVKRTSKSDFAILEKNLVEEKLKELKERNASEKVITNTMKDFGIERAKFYGLPNTYVFTKAMGEMLLRRSNSNLTFVIVRPTIVTGTYNEPFPGWTQGYRTVDSVIATYGKGKLSCLLFDPKAVLDMIPVDMVINSMIAAAVVNASKSCGAIYHVGSSMRNPIDCSDVHNFSFQYFNLNPWINQNGKPIKVSKVTIFQTMATFHMYMTIRYMLPLKGLEFVSKAFGRHFQVIHAHYDRKLKLVMRMVELYCPYLLFKGIFDDTDTEELRRITRENFIDAEHFSFDPTCIDWEDYMVHTHIPGFLKNVLIK